MLSDGTIQKCIANGQLTITDPSGPLLDEQWQPASVDLRLGMVQGADDAHVQAEGEGHTWVLWPGGFYLASTVETVGLSPMLTAVVHGKSSWARRGLQVHAAGFIDPGFAGEIVLELYVMDSEPVEVQAGKRICQLTFDWMDTRPKRMYGDPALRNRYNGQSGVVGAREWVKA